MADNNRRRCVIDKLSDNGGQSRDQSDTRREHLKCESVWQKGGRQLVPQLGASSRSVQSSATQLLRNWAPDRDLAEDLARGADNLARKSGLGLASARQAGLRQLCR
jgi:hypothetical protein